MPIIPDEYKPLIKLINNKPIQASNEEIRGRAEINAPNKTRTKKDGKQRRTHQSL